MEELTYDQFLFAARKIAQKSKGYDIESIYGIPRGGQVLAVYLSHLTGLPVIKEKDIKEKTLIIDDIADTGETLVKFKDYIIATIYYHKQSKIEPDIWIYKKKDAWIKFPWETDATTKN